MNNSLCFNTPTQQVCVTVSPVTTEVTLSLVPSEEPMMVRSAGSGMIRLTFNTATGTVCYALATQRLSSPITGGHIHQAPRGVAGPVVVDLLGPTRLASNGCVMADPALIQRILSNPTAFYVNIHTTQYPDGEIRAQLA